MMTARFAVVDRALLVDPAPVVAPRLLNRGLVVDGCLGRITEVEAYTSDDPASHSRRGPTPRSVTMFGRAGLLYVYLIYGMYHCANVVTGPDGDGQAVLIRAIEPLQGLDVMRHRRQDRRHLADGPGKLCQALAVDRRDDGTDLCSPTSRARLVDLGLEPPTDPPSGTRIGISAGLERPWRWWVG